MGWKDVLKYNPKEMDAKRAKIQRRNEYLRRQKKRDKELSRDFAAKIARREADANLIRDLKTDKNPTKRIKKPKKGRLPPKPQRGRKK
jgi:hypothetical protein